MSYNGYLLMVKNLWRLYCYTSGVALIVIIIACSLYIIKSKYGYDIFKHGGWHTFEGCIIKGFELSSLSPEAPAK